MLGDGPFGKVSFIKDLESEISYDSSSSGDVEDISQIKKEQESNFKHVLKEDED